MAWDKAIAVRGTLVRLIRLGADGTPSTGGTNVYITSGFTEFSEAPQINTGKELTIENADGGVCYSDKLPDTLLRVNLTLKFCYPDPTRDAFMLGGAVVTASTEPIGYNYPAVNVDPNPNGISVEIWQRAKTAGGAPATLPFYRYLAPRTFWRPDTVNVDQNPLVTSLIGYGTENPNWGTGPETDYTGGSASVFSYRRMATAPTATA